jgi:hypothetical protein
MFDLYLVSYNKDFMNLKLKRNAWWLAFGLLFLITNIRAFVFKELKVTATALTTNVTTSYTIFFDRTITNSYTTTAYATTPLNSSSTVTLTFPIQYALNSNVTCSYQVNTTGSYITTPCTELNNQITITNIFTAATTLANVTVLVGNVLNPFPAGKTSNFTGTIGSDVAQPNGVNSLVTITAAASICSFTFSPDLVYST